MAIRNPITEPLRPIWPRSSFIPLLFSFLCFYVFFAPYCALATLHMIGLWSSRVNRPFALFLFTFLVHVRFAVFANSPYSGFLSLGAGLSVGLAGLAAGVSIGIVGDAGVRGSAQVRHSIKVHGHVYSRCHSLFIATACVRFHGAHSHFRRSACALRSDYLARAQHQGQREPPLLRRRGW